MSQHHEDRPSSEASARQVRRDALHDVTLELEGVRSLTDADHDDDPTTLQTMTELGYFDAELQSLRRALLSRDDQ